MAPEGRAPGSGSRLRGFPSLHIHPPRHTGARNTAAGAPARAPLRPEVQPDLHPDTCSCSCGLHFLCDSGSVGSGLRTVRAQAAGGVIPAQAGWAPFPTSGPRSPDPTGRPGVQTAPSGTPGTGSPGPGRGPQTTALPRIHRCLGARGRKAPRHTLQLPQPPKCGETQRASDNYTSQDTPRSQRPVKRRLPFIYYNSQNAPTTSENYTSQGTPRHQRSVEATHPITHYHSQNSPRQQRQKLGASDNCTLRLTAPYHVSRKKGSRSHTKRPGTKRSLRRQSPDDYISQDTQRPQRRGVMVPPDKGHCPRATTTPRTLRGPSILSGKAPPSHNYNSQNPLQSQHFYDFQLHTTILWPERMS